MAIRDQPVISQTAIVVLLTEFLQIEFEAWKSSEPPEIWIPGRMPGSEIRRKLLPHGRSMEEETVAYMSKAARL